MELDVKQSQQTARKGVKETKVQSVYKRDEIKKKLKNNNKNRKDGTVKTWWEIFLCLFCSKNRTKNAHTAKSNYYTHTHGPRKEIESMYMTLEYMKILIVKYPAGKKTLEWIDIHRNETETEIESDPNNNNDDDVVEQQKRWLL